MTRLYSGRYCYQTIGVIKLVSVPKNSELTEASWQHLINRVKGTHNYQNEEQLGVIVLDPQGPVGQLIDHVLSEEHYMGKTN